MAPAFAFVLVPQPAFGIQSPQRERLKMELPTTTTTTTGHQWPTIIRRSKAHPMAPYTHAYAEAIASGLCWHAGPWHQGVACRLLVWFLLLGLILFFGRSDNAQHGLLVLLALGVDAAKCGAAALGDRARRRRFRWRLRRFWATLGRVYLTKSTSIVTLSRPLCRRKHTRTNV